MKVKNLMLAASTTVVALSFYSCTQEPIFDADKEEYVRSFIQTFGLIDQHQDWNMAETSSVTVNVGEHADSVKVYAKINGKYYVMARYTDVKGSMKIPFAAPAGTNELIVRIDNKNINARIGDMVSRNGVASRSIFATDDEDALIQISEAATPLYFNTAQIAPILKNWEKTGGEYNPAYRWVDYINGEGVLRENTFADDDPKAYGLIPEGNTDNYNNPNVVKHFWFTGVGPEGITIYPVFWNTSETYHEIGIFYFEKDGNPVPVSTDGATLVRVPVFNDKNYNESNPQLTLNTSYIAYTDNPTASKIEYSGQNTEWYKTYDQKQIVLTALAELYPSLNGDYTSLLKPEKYTAGGGWGRPMKEEVWAKILNYLKENYSGQTFTPDGKSNAISYDDICDVLPVWFSNYDIQLELCITNYDTPTRNDLAYAMNVIQRGVSVGINVKVPEDLEFGFYIKRSDGLGGYYYSISDYNQYVYSGGTEGFWDPDADAKVYKEPFACTFKHQSSGNQFFSFEDAANSKGDWDLNDLVFRLNGTYTTKTTDNKTTEKWDDLEIDKTKTDNDNPVTPNNPDEDQEPSTEAFNWMLAIEDLGSIGDFDFNDLVVGINCVTVNDADDTEGIRYLRATDEGPMGESDVLYKVTFKAMAAGGTLKAYLYYDNVKLMPDGDTGGDGEWHSWFGNFSSTKMINTGEVKASGMSATYLVKNFDLSTFLTSAKIEDSGFKVIVENNDSERTIRPAETGMAPMMFLVPDTPTWLWPLESVNIKAAYPYFLFWVSGSVNGNAGAEISDPADWYKYPTSARVFKR